MPGPDQEAARGPEAVSLFTGLLAGSEYVEPEAFEDLCRAHPELDGELRRMREHWERGQAALRCVADQLSLSARLRARFGKQIDPKVSLEEEPAAAPGSAWSSLFERLRTHAADETRYKPKGEIARGGMGAIVKVWDEDLRRVLAKKILIDRPDRARAADPRVDFDRIVGRFLEEAQITAQLDHPGIVPVHELGLDSDGRVYFTMKLVRGRDLKAIFELVEHGEEEWSLTRAVGVLLRVCEAMAFAHEKGVVHRDLKPGNVMVGRFGEVYVMDWGLARVLGREDTKDVRLRGEPMPSSDIVTARSERTSESASPLMTIDGDVVGTPVYMSPEQARGEVAEVGPRSDVYAVGAMLYQLLTGQMPYVRPGMQVAPHAVWRWVLDGPPARIEAIRATAPPELVAICEKAMARESRRRYPDMLALAGDLRAFLENRVVKAHRTGAVAEARKWVVRNRLAAGIALALVLVVVAGALTSAWLESRRRTVVERSLVEQTAAALVSEAAGLDTIDPDRAPAMREWLERARSVAPRLQDYERELADFESAHVDASQSPDPNLRPPDEFERKRLVEQDRAYRGFLDSFRGERNDLAARASLSGEDSARLAKLEWDIGVLELELADLPGRIEAFDARLAALRTRRFLDPDLEERFTRLSKPVADLRALSRRGGLMSIVESRLHAAESLRARSIEDSRSAWDAARASIADRSDCPLYDGLDLAPQLGLIPLRRDPGSGLWEFWHVLSGDRPALGADGRWRIEPETGVVLVLVPGGRVHLGAQRFDPARPNWVDAESFATLPTNERAGRGERATPVTVQLWPYFLSKYELTQAQWLRMTGERPSTRFAGNGFAGQWYISRTHPVESVDWSECDVVLRRFGLALPTEAQWELAARAGTSGLYGPGADATGLGGAVNGSAGYPEPAGADRYAYHAPVGAFAPNRWGFADLHGNVWEWCADWYNTYEHVVAVGERDGLLTPDFSLQKSLRGGSFESELAELRIGQRAGRTPAYRDDDLGVRPSRAIQE